MRITHLFRIQACGILLATGLLNAGSSPIGVVEIQSWSSFTSGLSEFCQSAGLPFALTAVNDLAGKALRLPNLAGLDVRSPIRLYVLPPTGATSEPLPLPVSVVPVTDGGAAAIDALRAIYSESSVSADATHIFEAPSTAFEVESIALRIDNNLLLIAEKAATLDTLAEFLATKEHTDVARVSGDLRLTLYSEAFVPFLETLAEQAPAQMLAQNRMLLDLLRQIRQLALGVTASDEHTTIFTRLDALPGTAVQAFFEKQSAPGPRYRGILPPETLIGSVGGGMDAFSMLAEPYAEWFQQMLPDNPSVSDTIKEAFLLGAEHYSGDYAAGLLHDAETKGLVWAQFVAVKDQEAVREAQHRGMEISKRLLADMATQEAQGLLIKELPAREHDGVSILAYRYALTGEDLGPAKLAEGFLSELAFEQAVTENDAVMSFGRLGAIDALLDRLKQDHEPLFVERVLGLFPDLRAAAEPVEIAYLAPMALIRRLVLLLPEPTAQNLVEQLPQPGEGLGILTLRQHNTMFCAMRLAANELQALVALSDRSDALAPILQSAIMELMSQGMNED